MILVIFIDRRFIHDNQIIIIKKELIKSYYLRLYVYSYIITFWSHILSIFNSVCSYIVTSRSHVLSTLIQFIRQILHQ